MQGVAARPPPATQSPGAARLIGRLAKETVQILAEIGQETAEWLRAPGRLTERVAATRPTASRSRLRVAAFALRGVAFRLRGSVFALRGAAFALGVRGISMNHVRPRFIILISCHRTRNALLAGGRSG